MCVERIFLSSFVQIVKVKCKSKKQIILCVWWRCVKWASVPKLVAKLRSSNFCLEDAPRSGRSVETDEDTIKTWIDAKRHVATCEIVNRLNLSSSIVHHLKRLGLISKFNISVSYFRTKKCFLKESFGIKKLILHILLLEIGTQRRLISSIKSTWLETELNVVLRNKRRLTQVQKNNKNLGV